MKIKRAIVAAICALLIPFAYAKTVDEADMACPDARSNLDPRIQSLNDALSSVGLSNTERAAAFLQRGNVLRERGSIRCAVTDYDAAIATDPKMAEAFVARSLVWLTQRDLARATADLDAAIAANPKYPSAHYLRGRVWNTKGDTDQAIASFDRAVELHPTYLAAIYERGQAWGRKRNFDKEIADYDTVVRLNPAIAEVFVRRANAWDNKGESDRALADYDTAIKLNPNFASAYKERGVALAARGEYERAIADLDSAVRINPKSADALKARGRTRFLKGEFKTATEDLWQAQQVFADPYSIIWHYLASGRSGMDARGALAKSAADKKLDTWPGPLFALLMGDSTPEAAMAKAKNPNPMVQRDQMCEAHFYIGQWRLLKGDRAGAIADLRKAESECPREFVEKVSATVELKRLK